MGSHSNVRSESASHGHPLIDSHVLYQILIVHHPSRCVICAYYMGLRTVRVLAVCSSDGAVFRT